MRFRWARSVGETVLLAAVYFAVARLSLSLRFASGNVTPVWPPSGMALAALLLFGRRLWPGIAVGAFLTVLSTRAPLTAAAGIAAGNALEALAAFWLLTRRTRFRSTLEHPRDVGALIVAAAVASLIAATVGTGALRLTGVISHLELAERWFAWWFGDAVGIVVLAPALLTWLTRPPPRRGAANAAEGVALWVALALMTYLVFGRGFPYPYPIFAILAWTGLRFGPRGASAVVLALAKGIAWTVLQGPGPSGTQTMEGSIVHLLAFVALAGGTTLMLAAAVAERAAARDVERSHLGFLNVIFGAIDSVFVKDREGHYVFANAAAARVAGLPAAEMVGKTDIDLFPPEVSPSQMAADRAVMQSGETRTLEERLLLGGEDRRFLTTRGPYRDERGGIAGVIGIARDVTALKRTEESLRESEEKFRSLVESAPDYICALDREGKFLFMNRTASGYEMDKVIGTSVYEYLPARSREIVRATLEEVFRTGRPSSYEIEGAGADGVLAWYQCSVGPIVESGRVKSVIITSHDVTQRRAMEERLRESEEKFRSLVENAPDFIATIDRDGVVEFLNRAGAGEEVGMFLGKSAGEYLPPADRERAWAAITEVFRSGEPATLEIAWVRPPEPRRFFRCRIGPLTEAGRVRAALIIASDITEARKAEDELRLSRSRLQALSRRLIEAQETERRHISRELHDEIGQALTAVKISLQSASRKSGGTIADDLQESIAVVEHSLGQVRDLSVALRPSLLDDLGLVPALRWYLDQQAARAGFVAEFSADPDVDAAPEVQTACFRIAQEALTNVARHAKARNVRLEVREGEGELQVKVSDDGRGFDVAQVLERTGGDVSLGLLGMSERARLLGGRVTIRSAPGDGTVIDARFPAGGTP